MCEKEKEWTNEFDNKLKQFKANKNSIINSIRLEYKFKTFFRVSEDTEKNYKKEVFCVKMKLLKSLAMMSFGYSDSMICLYKARSPFINNGSRELRTQQVNCAAQIELILISDYFKSLSKLFLSHLKKKCLNSSFFFLLDPRAQNREATWNRRRMRMKENENKNAIFCVLLRLMETINKTKSNQREQQKWLDNLMKRQEKGQGDS